MSKGVTETRRQIDGSHSIDLDSSTLDQIRQEINVIGFAAMPGCTAWTVSGSVPGRSQPCLSNQPSLSTRGDDAALRHLQLICRDNQISKTDLFACSAIAVSLSYCQQTVNMSCHLPVWVFSHYPVLGDFTLLGPHTKCKLSTQSHKERTIFQRLEDFSGTDDRHFFEQGFTSCSVVP
ncbi:hypothetical protein BDV11DRAFT_30277 [Aspergillus similis]